MKGQMKTRPDYPATLMSIEIGETKEFAMGARTYHSFMCAKSRIHKEGRARFEMRLIENTLFITRTK